jgi:hypothetical protein
VGRRGSLQRMQAQVMADPGGISGEIGGIAMKKYYFKHGIVSGIYCFTLKKFIRTFSLFNNDKIISGYGYK